MDFIYHGNVQITNQERVYNFIAVARPHRLSDPKEVAGKFLEHNLTIFYCFSAFQLAENYLCAGKLISKIRKFIDSNFTVVAETVVPAMAEVRNGVEKWLSID